MALVYRNILGPVAGPDGTVLALGELRVKPLAPIVDGTTFISPEELVIPIEDGLFTLVLAAPANYEFLVIDQYDETLWNFQAGLSGESAADIRLSELYLLSGVEVDDVIDLSFTFPQLLDVPLTYTDQAGKLVAVNEAEDGLVFTTPLPITTGSGSPEGAVTAPVGSMFLRTDGGVGTTLYVKESGTGNTGWAAK